MTIGNERGRERSRLTKRGVRFLGAVLLVGGGLMGHYSEPVIHTLSDIAAISTNEQAPSLDQLRGDPTKAVIVKAGQGEQSVIDEVDNPINQATLYVLEQYLTDHNNGSDVLQVGQELKVPIISTSVSK